MRMTLSIANKSGGIKVYMADFFILGILAIVVFFILRSRLRKSRQQGGGCPGCSGCSACSGHNSCNLENK